MRGSSDFENKFVCGEIMSYEDLHEYGSESAVKAAGKLKQQGKTYESESPSPFSLCRFLGVGGVCGADDVFVRARVRSGRWRYRVLEGRRVDRLWAWLAA